MKLFKSYGIVSVGNNPNTSTSLRVESQHTLFFMSEVRRLLNGHKVLFLEGTYEGQRELSIMVENIDLKALLELGELLNQESVIYVDGQNNYLIYLDGPNKGLVYKGVGMELVNGPIEDNYSHIIGTNINFNLNFNWDEAFKLKEVLL